jgi:hypothetical protein
MLYSEIITVCSQIHTKHINTLCGQNVGFFNVKPGATKSMFFKGVKGDIESTFICISTVLAHGTKQCEPS